MEKTFTAQEVQAIATQAVENHVSNGGNGIVSKALDGVTATGRAIAEETQANAKREAGRRLYDNIEELINSYILSKMNFMQRWLTSDKTKRMAVLVGTYTVIHAIKSGGFGLTNYRINHAMLDLLSSECNARIMSSVLGGFDTNIAKALFTKPEVTEVVSEVAGA
jgi:hypothetical protein